MTWQFLYGNDTQDKAIDHVKISHKSSTRLPQSQLLFYVYIVAIWSGALISTKHSIFAQREKGDEK